LIIRLWKFLFIILIAINQLTAAAEQTWLPNGLWKLISYKGVYTQGSSDYTKWEDDGLTEISDRADFQTTYAKSNAALDDHETMTVATSQIGATIGLFAIKGGKSPSIKKTELDGSEAKSIKLKIKVGKKKGMLPMYRMYVAGQPNVPAIRIDYQADYEGEEFKIKFGDEDYAFIGNFSSYATFSSPSKVENENTKIKSVSVTEANIKDVFDFNITDNSFTKMEKSTFDLSKDVRPFNSANGDNLIVYTMEHGSWKIFNSSNSKTSSNDFNKLKMGKGYWVQAMSVSANRDGNNTKIGLISSSNTLFTRDLYKELSDDSFNGWNMLAFKSSSLRHSPTAMFVPSNVPPFKLFLSVLGSNIEDLNRTMGGFINMNDMNTSALYTPPSDMAQKINTIAQSRRLFYGEDISLRAFPAMSVDGNSGIIILSDMLFEVNSSNTSITTLTGNSLVALNNGYRQSVYGEYMLGFRLNDLSGSEINGTINITTPSVSTGEYRIYDLNGTDKLEKLAKILLEFNRSATDSGGTTRTDTSGFLVDFDINGSADYTSANNFKDILLISGKRFSIEDTTYTKVYKHKNNGPFRIVGESSVDVSITSGVASSAILQTQFANGFDQTKVKYTALGTATDGTTYFVITSNKTINLDLLENDPSKTLFEDLPLGTTLPPEGNISFIKGAITKVFTHASLLYTSSIDFNQTRFDGNMTYGNVFNDINYTLNNKTGTFTSILGNTVNDLKISPVWSLDFPVKGPILDFALIGKKIESILTLKYTNNFEPYWLMSDLTNDPDKWYGNSYKAELGKGYNSDSQSILRLEKNQGYWVKLATFKKVPIKLNKKNSGIAKLNIVHFDGDVLKADNPISLTSNHIDHTLVLEFENASIETSAYYDVSAIIQGKRYQLRRVGKKFQLRINDIYLDLKPSGANSKGIPIIIEAYDYLGNFMDKADSTYYTIPFSKPATPGLSWSFNGEMIVTNRSLNDKVSFYVNYISDVASDRNKNYVDVNESNLSGHSDLLGWKQDKLDDYGKIRILRAVAERQGSYSNVRSVMYAPLKFGHILEANTTDIFESSPYSFFKKSFLTENGRLTNNGVQIKRLTQAVEDNKTIKMVYYPAGGPTMEGKKKLSAFGGQYTMFFKLQSSDPSPLASITFISEYSDKLFYIDYNSKLYQGRFAKDDRFNSDSKAYILTGNSKINVDGIIKKTDYNTSKNGFELDYTGSTGKGAGITTRAKVVLLPDIEYTNNQSVYIPGKYDETSASKLPASLKSNPDLIGKSNIKKDSADKSSGNNGGLPGD